MSIFTALEKDFEDFWNNHVKPFVHNDVEPALKKFVQQFDSKFGMQAITAALSAVAALETGSAFGATATSLATTLYKEATTDAASIGELDATEILQTVQAALQVAKTANNVITPADQTAAAAISAPAA